jgi:hypothetical protein
MLLEQCMTVASLHCILVVKFLYFLYLIAIHSSNLVCAILKLSSQGQGESVGSQWVINAL